MTPLPYQRDHRRGRLLPIAVDVGITQERSESMQVHPDSQFLMTDLVLQTPAVISARRSCCATATPTRGTSGR